MRIICALFAWLIWTCAPFGLQAAPAKILKVLPHYLDEEGRHSLSPSLYERDAYQALLRQDPEKTSGLRFDVNWKAKRKSSAPLRLRIELRTSGRDASSPPLILERNVRPARFFSTWSSLRVPEQEYKAFGQLIAWRATLWDGEVLLAEERSFLW